MARKRSRPTLVPPSADRLELAHGPYLTVIYTIFNGNGRGVDSEGVNNEELVGEMERNLGVMMKSTKRENLRLKETDRI